MAFETNDGLSLPVFAQHKFCGVALQVIFKEIFWND